MSIRNNLHVVPNANQLLRLAPNLTIHSDVIVGDGNGILATGMPGSGKTTLIALLLEQLGLCQIPFAVFDLEGDLASILDLLPRGVLATATNCPTPRDMHEGLLQVVFDLESWQDHDEAANMIETTVNGLMHYTKALPSQLRVPFIVGLDEAAYWLPQSHKGKGCIEEEHFRGLFTAFHNLAIRGRKMGLIPLLGTQRFAEVHNGVIASSGTFVLMRHTSDADLKRYMEYINIAGMADAYGRPTGLALLKSRIASFKQGEAIVRLPNGEQSVVQFHNRQSEHISHAPKTQAAINAARTVRFDPNRRYGSFTTPISMTEDTPCTDIATCAAPENAHPPLIKKEPYGALAQRAREVLASNPSLRTGELAIAANCSPRVASYVKRRQQA